MCVREERECVVVVCERGSETERDVLVCVRGGEEREKLWCV